MSEDLNIPPLVIQLMEQSRRDLAFTTDSLITNLTRQTRIQEATLILIREKISLLLSGPYMPGPRAIEEALYPRPHVIMSLVEDLRISRGES